MVCETLKIPKTLNVLRAKVFVPRPNYITKSFAFSQFCPKLTLTQFSSVHQLFSSIKLPVVSFYHKTDIICEEKTCGCFVSYSSNNTHRRQTSDFIHRSRGILNVRSLTDALTFLVTTFTRRGLVLIDTPPTSITALPKKLLHLKTRNSHL